MVQNLALSTNNMHYSNMSINSSISSVDPVESDIIAFQEIPLTALSKRTLRKLSYLLNSKKILRSEEGYERDWRGLACLAKQKCLCDENAISGDDPMMKVIQLWCTNNPKTATFAYLEQFLGIIDRWDVCDDIYENLGKLYTYIFSLLKNNCYYIHFRNNCYYAYFRLFRKLLIITYKQAK